MLSQLPRRWFAAIWLVGRDIAPTTTSTRICKLYERHISIYKRQRHLKRIRGL